MLHSKFSWLTSPLRVVCSVIWFSVESFDGIFPKLYAVHPHQKNTKHQKITQSTQNNLQKMGSRGEEAQSSLLGSVMVIYWFIADTPTCFTRMVLGGLLDCFQGDHR